MTILNFTKVGDKYYSDAIVPGDRGLATIHMQFAEDTNMLVVEHTLDESKGWEVFPPEYADEVFETTISGAVPGQKVRIQSVHEPTTAQYQVF